MSELYQLIDGKLYCRHGLILYGKKCLNCERSTCTHPTPGSPK